jgi:DNA-binding beta-propeller fold protein YncE
VNAPLVSRRALLALSAAALGCGHKKATGFHGFCFVANQEGRSVAVVDLTRFRVRRQIPLDASPASVIAHPTEAKVYVLAPEAGTIYEIDAVRLEVARRTRAAASAVQMHLATKGDALWVLSRDAGGLVEVPFATFRPARRVPAPAPDSFNLSQDGRAAIVSSRERMVAIAPLDGGAGRLIRCADEPSLVQFRKDGRQVLVASTPARSLTIYDAATGGSVVRLPLPVEPRHMTVNGDGGQVFLTGDGMDAVVVIYPYETEVAETFLAGHTPAGMAVTDLPEYLMVANPDAGTVTVLDFQNSGKLVAAVQVGRLPGQIVLTPPRPGEDQYALVLNEGSGDLAVIRVNTLVNTDPLRRYQPRPVFTLLPVGEKPVSAAVVAFG